MTLIVNLSTTHDYSIKETIAAFVQLCNKYSTGCLQGMPFFQSLTNYSWVTTQYQKYYTSLIEPYKLGKISTEEFLENLSKIFDFMSDMDKSERHSLLADAWNASIKITEKTHDRLSFLVNQAKTQPAYQPVYLISNTNELNVNAIINLFQKNNPDLKFKDNIDTTINASKKPIEILPNIYLCLSYRFGAFKTPTTAPTTASLLEHVSKQCRVPITLVSQHPEDLKKGDELCLANVLNAEEFYNSEMTNSLMKKAQ